MVLSVLILIGMVRELLADMKRYRTDKQSNAQPAHLLTGKILETEAVPINEPDADL
jgi:hypothetical protein